MVGVEVEETTAELPSIEYSSYDGTAYEGAAYVADVIRRSEIYSVVGSSAAGSDGMIYYTGSPRRGGRSSSVGRGSDEAGIVTYREDRGSYDASGSS